MPSVVETRGLTKRFGAIRAVDGLNLNLDRGEVYGFLGRNGAGKTTTIRLLLGLVRPDFGSVAVLGRRIVGGRGPWDRVGSLVEAAAAWPELSVVQNLRTLADLHGGKAACDIDRWMGALDLTNLADRRAGRLSQGNLQRLALALALLPDPDLLILDEPINGLDPAGVVQVRELLRTLVRERGTTVFVSSHRLDEVARTASRIGILHQGRLVEELGRAELARFLTQRLIVGTPAPARAAEALTRAGYTVGPGPEPDTLDLGGGVAEGVAPVLVAAGVPLSRLGSQGEDLEDHFLRLTGVEE